MLRLFLSISLAVLLSGCATQFGTKKASFIHHRPQAHVVAPVGAPAPAPISPATFRKRFLSKFFVKRATEK